MATEVGVGYVRLLPSARGFTGEMRRELGGPVQSAGTEGGRRWGSGFLGSAIGAVRSLVGSIGSTLTTGIQAAGIVAGGFLAASLTAGWQRLTTIQDATAALTVSLGSATKASSLLGDVLGVVRGTPFNLDQFAAAAQRLVGFGVEVQKVPRFLTAIGE